MSKHTIARIPVSGMTCAACQARVQKTLQQQPGVADAAVNLMMGTATVSYDSEAVTPEALVSAIQETGYGAELPRDDRSAFEEQDARDKATAEEFADLKHKAIVSGVIGSISMAVMPFMHSMMWITWVLLFVTAAVMATAGRHFYVRAWKAFTLVAPHFAKWRQSKVQQYGKSV